jgi:hypothetical protein
MISLESSRSDINAPASRKSSIFLRRVVGSMLMRVNSKCAHQVRPPLDWIWEALCCRDALRDHSGGIDSLKGPSVSQHRHSSPLTRAAKQQRVPQGRALNDLTRPLVVPRKLHAKGEVCTPLNQ